MDEIKRLEVIQKVESKQLTGEQAAKLLKACGKRSGK